MAVDTRDKRASIARAGPLPDASISNVDRRHIAGFRRRSLYRYVSAAIVIGPFDVPAAQLFFPGNDIGDTQSVGDEARELYSTGYPAAEMDA